MTRFRKSKDLGPYFGLTPSKYQSGEVDWTGRISKVGDVMAYRLVRSGQCHAQPGDAVLGTEGLGAAHREAARGQADEGGAGAQTGGRAAPHVGRRRRLPLAQGSGLNSLPDRAKEIREGRALRFNEVPS